MLRRASSPMFNNRLTVWIGGPPKGAGTARATTKKSRNVRSMADMLQRRHARQRIFCGHCRRGLAHSGTARESSHTRSASFRRSQSRISSIFVSTNVARRRLSLGSIGGFLVRKLVKPTKVCCSWTSYQRRFGKVWPSQTKSDVGTADAGVLGEADATVGQELSRFDPTD